jgi:hypothetical protein
VAQSALLSDVGTIETVAQPNEIDEVVRKVIGGSLAALPMHEQVVALWLVNCTSDDVACVVNLRRQLLEQER